MLGGKSKVHIVSPLERFGLDILFYVEDSAGHKAVGKFQEDGYLEYTEHFPGKMIDKKAFIKLTREEAFGLFEGLLNHFDPPAKQATEEKLQATEKHLVDIQDILKKVLPSALRGKHGA